MKRTAIRLSAAALVAGAIVAPQWPAAAAQRATPTISIAAKSTIPKVTGDVFVRFDNAAERRATISGTARGAATGEVLRLYAQQFPFRKAPVAIGHSTVGSATQPYSFRVTPTLATRYQVKLYANGTSHTVLASSAKVIVYVAVNGVARGGSSCSRPVCHQTWHLHEFVPPSALRTEMPKRWFIYFGLKLNPNREPAPPRFLTLGAGSPQVSAPTKINAHEYAVTIKFTFRVGNDGYYYLFDACQRDTEAKDGLNLPGHHGCGTLKVIRSHRSYLG